MSMNQIPVTTVSSNPRYAYREDYPVEFAMTPKCGSTSATRALRREGFKIADNNSKRLSRRPDGSKPVVMIVREPIERIVSAYHYFIRDNDCLPGGMRFQGSTREMPLETFVQNILTHHNYHWTPQTFQHPDWRQYELVPLDDMNLVWAHFGDLGEPLHVRQSSRSRAAGDRLSGISQSILATLYARYADDAAAYEKALRWQTQS